MRYMSELKHNNITLESLIRIYEWRFNTYRDKFLISKIPSIEEHISFISSESYNSNSNWFAYFEKVNSIQLPKIIGCSTLYNYSEHLSSVSFGRLMVDPSFNSLGIASKLINQVAIPNPKPLATTEAYDRKITYLDNYNKTSMHGYTGHRRRY